VNAASFLLAVGFISPGLFAAGAAAALAPVLIHLLARRRFKRIRWAAVDFLLDAERRNRRRIRLEEWVLLGLRCLAVLLISLIVSRPYLTPSGLAAGLGGSSRIERVFVLDDSYSMGYAALGGTSFEKAKLGVRGLLASIREEGPDDTVTLIRMSAPAQPLASGTFLDQTQTEELLARLEALSPSQRSMDPVQVVGAVAEWLERTPAILNATVYVLSDFQYSDWIDREPAETAESVGQGIFEPLMAWARKDRGLQLLLVDVGADEPSNTAVTDLSVVSGQVVAGTPAKLRATVANFADRPTGAIQLDVTVGPLAQASKAVPSIGPYQTASVDLELEFPRESHETVRVELPADALLIDNARQAAVEVANAIRVLVVDGEPSADEYEDEVFFLRTALRPEGEVFSGNEVVTVDEAGLETASLSGYHVVVLCNVYRVSEPAMESLEQFVRRGGGLVIFLGDQVDAELYNAVLFREGQGLLPAELGERIRSAGAAHLVVSDRLHPVMRGLSREGDPLGIGQVPFFEFFTLSPFGAERDGGDEAAAEAPEAAEAAEAAAAPVGRPARVIASLSGDQEHPAMVERPFGLGMVMLVATSADKEWHLWPDHPTYLPLMMELIQTVVRRDAGDSGLRVGSAIELPVDPAMFEPDVMVRTPAYPAEREVGVTALPASDGRGLTATWEHTDVAGIYQFVLGRNEGGETTRFVAINVDPRESDLTRAGEDALRQSAGDAPCRYVRGVEHLDEGSGEARAELWRMFLVAAVAVLMSEQFLAWFWGRRR